MTSNVVVCEDAEDLARRAASLFIDIVCGAISCRGSAKVALSGGSTPEKMYRLLTEPENASKLDWSRTLVIMGDERFVPDCDPQSNYGMAYRTLLSKVPIPDGNVIHVSQNAGSAQTASQAYELALRKDVPDGILDLVLLGLGEDGHTASLFPQAPSLAENNRWVVASPPGSLPPPVDRITLTYPIINRARNVLFLVSGKKKSATLNNILRGQVTPEQMPAAGIQPTNGQLIWLVDRDATGNWK